MLKSKIEAILFLTDKPMRAQAIARIVNEDVQIVRQAVLDLIHDYEERASGLEIADDNGYIIQVKDEYASIIDEFVPMEMPVALIRTLSAIAIKQPVAQSEIIKIRGAGAYDHIKELMTRELIIKKEDGRSPLLSTTKKFQEYFRLSQDAKSLRTQLRKEEKVAIKDAEVGEGDGSGNDSDNHADVNNLDKAKQLEVLFASSPDSSLVFRPNDLTGTPPAGFDFPLGGPDRRADLSTEAIIDSLTGEEETKDLGETSSANASGVDDTSASADNTSASRSSESIDSADATAEASDDSQE